MLRHGAKSDPYLIPEHSVVYKYGRPPHTESYDNDDSEGPFSTGLEAWDSIYDTFQKSTKEVFGDGDENLLVALLGVHMIGRASQMFSGFQGPWRRCGKPFVLSNRLFQLISNRGATRFIWSQTFASQHRGGNPFLKKDNIQWSNSR